LIYLIIIMRIMYLKKLDDKKKRKYFL